MIENNRVPKDKKANYRELVNQMGKKEFTLLKMQEYGFWPKDLPTPYEIQKNETPERYAKRQGLLKEYQRLIDQIAKLYEEKDDINKKLWELKKEYDDTWDLEKIRLDISQKIMRESIERRAERKKQRELEKQKRSLDWQQKKSEQIVFIGRGYSSLMNDTQIDEEKLKTQELPIIKTDRDLAEVLGIDYPSLRFLTYHREVVSVDHYHHFKIPKKKGGERSISAPKSKLKTAQRAILEKILSKLNISDQAHGFLKGRSVVSGAQTHISQPALLINMDLEDFFPTLTFERVLGMFRAFGYSGYISSLIAMLCTYCERMEIEVKGKPKYVATSKRILPQGSPASPMITNIICRDLDKRLNGLAKSFGFIYTRYADDMSFSINEVSDLNEGRFCGLVSKIVSEEGFKINKAKTRYLRKNNCQSVTGIVVNNDQLAVRKKWVKRFRAAIYNARKQKAAGELSNATKNEISGMAAWLKSVNEEKYRDMIGAVMDIVKED
ncbi:MAG: Reverse transcriptase (RNA-dependent DNA polymerase) [Firmicutes bacterium ADurb.Bin419]|nr:MAG: Reverse transcriptase (RNA-dependent DNA polymerase) [Firmicutes bacterium ADurb.Bin419]